MGVNRVMLRSIMFLGLGVLVLGAAGDLRPPSPLGGEQFAVDSACEYYRRRGGSQPRREPVAFAGFLTEACTAARQSLESDSPHQSAAALQLLRRIALLHQTIREMNAARELAVEGKVGIERMRSLTRVTPTGEFLIAHRLGLMSAFDAWLDTGAEFSLASYR